MATGQTLLDTMELLNQELQLQSGEVDVTRGLRALNVAQDYFEALIAVRGKLLGSSVGTVVTAAGVETTAFPTGLLRLDRMQLLDGSGRVTYELGKLQRAGGHASVSGWPQFIGLSSGSGNPQQYWTNGTLIYWSPLPSGVSTVRWYGFQAAADITASGTFAYPDIAVLPLASFAVKIMKMGVDDESGDVGALGQATFKSTLDAMEMFNRDGAVGFEYTRIHTE